MSEKTYTTRPTDEVPPRDLDAFVEYVQHEFRVALDKTSDWRSEAEMMFDYVSGDQWTDDDRSMLEEELRPVITFNRAEVFVSAVTGLETINREEVKYYPRKPGLDAQGGADIWNAASKYINDDSDAETHHSHAFRDMVISGMGWTETKLSFETNPDGDIDITRKNPLSMFYDPRATERNLKDARWVLELNEVPLEDIKEEWPEKYDEITFSKMFDTKYEMSNKPHHADKAFMYERDQARKYPIPRQVQLVKYQYYKKKPYYRVMTEQGVQDMSVSEYKEFREPFDEQGIPFPYQAMKLKRREYRQSYLVGDTVLEDEPLDIQAGFTFTCMTGKYDQNNGTWYGLVRHLKDPQDWTNKLFSQILHIINSNSKGGILAEFDAFVNPSKVEREWARPDKIIFLNEGALSQNKILERQPLQYPVGLDRLLNFAMQMFVEVSGINLELLGLADKAQAGVLEAQRKQAGMTILAWAFDSMRQYRKHHGKVLAAYIREYIADGRLIRISTEGTEQYIPLMRDDLAMEYDVVVDSSPTSVNEKDRVFAVLMQLLPTMARMGVMPPPDVIDYLPIPATLANAWKQAAAQAEQQGAKQAEAAKQMEQREKEAQAIEKETQAMYNQARAQSEAAEAQNKELGLD